MKITSHRDSRSESYFSVLLSHPTGNQNVRNALRGLTEHGMLAEFWTTIAWNPESLWSRLVPARLRNQLGRRTFEDVPRERVRCIPWREIVRLGAGMTPLGSALCDGERPFSVIGMYRHFDDKVAQHLPKSGADAVYAYEGGALRTFRQAKHLGLTAMYELPSSHWYWERNLFLEEAERNPEFAELLPALGDSARHMQEKDEELSLADAVFVPSQHVRDTLAGVVSENKIKVLSYGAPPVRRKKNSSYDSNQPLKALFVGSLTQRKGISYLLEAVASLKGRVELTLIGRRFKANPRVDEACNRWRWFEALQHTAVLELMQEADVLVLPSLSEGCALVVLEALACGLPVIVTPNTGSHEFVHDGREGFVVPICRADAIAERLNTLCHNRELLAAMSDNAHATAAEKSWKNYRDNWVDAVRDVTCR